MSGVLQGCFFTGMGFMKRGYFYFFTASLMLAAATVQADGFSSMSHLIGSSGGSDSVIETEQAAKRKRHDGILRLTPDKTHILRLNEDASSVIVTNPAHVSVMLDSPRLLVVMPRQPGATSFTVLNSKGDTILEQDVVVATNQPNYVRIRKMCTGDDASCAPSSYYYCPDGCYEVTTVHPGEGQMDVPEIAASAPVAAPDNMPVAAEPPVLPAPAVEQPVVEEDVIEGEE